MAHISCNRTHYSFCSITDSSSLVYKVIASFLSIWTLYFCSHYFSNVLQYIVICHRYGYYQPWGWPTFSVVVNHSKEKRSFSFKQTRKPCYFQRISHRLVSVKHFLYPNQLPVCPKLRLLRLSSSCSYPRMISFEAPSYTGSPFARAQLVMSVVPRLPGKAMTASGFPSSIILWLRMRPARGPSSFQSG